MPVRTRKKKQTNTTQTGNRYLYSAAVIGIVALGTFSAAFIGVPVFNPTTYSAPGTDNTETEVPDEQAGQDEQTVPVTHIEKPDHVRAIYMTACVAGTPSFREDLVEIVDETEINSLIIDIKDYTGGISFSVDDPMLAPAIGVNCFVRDMQEFINTLHAKGIYVIGRITVFQDPFLAPRKPEIAVRASAAADSPVWTDYKGIAFLDAGSQYAWDYTIALAEESYAIGFDEINFDYIRFPSDGNLKNAYFPVSEERITADPAMGKAEVVRDFFEYLDANLSDEIITSADLFGMTTTNTDDLNIGQVLEYAAPYFDYIAPMVYPSHYPSGFNGWANPNEYPYDVIEYSMGEAVERLTTMRDATTTPAAVREKVGPEQLRPWLQDFDYGGDYDIAEVRAQIQATYDVGLDSWMLWAPSNRYTRGALEPAEE